MRGILDYLRRIGRFFRSIRLAAANDNTCRCKGRFVGLAARTTRGRPKIRNGKSQRINTAGRKRKIVSSVEDVKEVLKELESSDEDQGDP